MKYHTEDMRTIEKVRSLITPDGKTAKDVWVLRAANGKYLDHKASLGILLDEHELRHYDLFEVE
jgi:hypothetical protein